MHAIETIKEKLKRIVFPALSYKCYIHGLFAKDPGSRFTIEEANDVISQFTKIPSDPFSMEVSKLAETSLDLSIIIPVYNAGKFLEECILSILNQKTEFTYEVICIDDGSKDCSSEILSKLKDSVGKDKMVVIRQENSGIAATRNAGIEIARGEYIGFMDNDDTVAENYIDVLLKSAKLNDADIVQSGYKCLDVLGVEHIGKVRPNIVTDDKNLIAKYCFGYIWSGVYRKALWEKIRFPKGYWYEDMITRMLVMRVAKKFVMVGEPLYYKLVHATNASKVLWNSANAKSFEAFYLAKYSADFAADKLGLKNDVTLMQQLMFEYSAMLSSRTTKLTETQRKAIFTLASVDLCNRFPDNLLKGRRLYNKLYWCFNTQNFKKWELYSRSLNYYSICAKSR